MSQLVFDLAGVASGTGVYNPVPTNFSASPSVVYIYAIVGNASKFICSLPNMNSAWAQNVLDSVGQNVEVVNVVNFVNPDVGTLDSIGIPRGYSNPCPQSATLVMNMTASGGNFQIMSNSNG